MVFGTGGNATLHYINGDFATSTDCFVVRASSEILVKYVYYFLFGNINILEEGFKGSGLKHISKSYLNSIQIPVPPLDTQRKIINAIDKVLSLIEKRKEQIALLDNALKSWFIYNVGPLSPEYNDWKRVYLKDIAANKKNSMRTGPFGSNLKHSEFVDSGIAVLGIDNAVENKFMWKQRRFITPEKYEKLKSYTVYPRDVIITIMGTTGRSAVIPDDIPLCINTKHLACITLNNDKANPYYISYSIHSHPFILTQIKKQNKGAIMDGLNLTIIKALEIPLPPIEYQNRFEEMYLKVEQQKYRLTQSLEELEITYKATMQKAFNGELF